MLAASVPLRQKVLQADFEQRPERRTCKLLDTVWRPALGRLWRHLKYIGQEMGGGRARVSADRLTPVVVVAVPLSGVVGVLLQRRSHC